MTKTVWFLLTILATSYVCNAYKILFISPVPGKSHNILGNGVVKHLLNSGHEVTYVTSTIIKKPPPNLHQIDVSSNWKLIPENLLSLESIMNGEFDITDNTMLNFMFHKFATETLQHPNIQNMLADKSQQFDVVIAEFMFNELYSGLAGIYDVPLVWFSTVEPHGQAMALVDEFLNTAYEAFYIDSVLPFSFADRVMELWMTVKNTIVKETIIRAMQHWEYKSLIAPHIQARGRVPPAFEDLKYNASLMLGNSHVSMGQATRLPQIYKPIGGYHIPDKLEPLPDDLKTIMDNSKDGVIYFSMGSNLKSKDMPDVLKKDFLNVFGSLKQTVLWKFEEDLPNLPKNVHILKWAPQQTILAHPNCVLFITHGGLLSITETIHAGVPVIGIPVFADQFSNVNKAVHKGFAKKVQLSYTMASDLKDAIQDIISDPKYKIKVKELSFIYHDRPIKPGAELVHWVEHVIKTKGAPHLRSPALLVPWYQKYYLDLAILLAAIVYVLKKVFKTMLPVIFHIRVKLKTN